MPGLAQKLQVAKFGDAQVRLSLDIAYLETGKIADVPAYKCPRCGRQFASAKQSHECSPAMSLEEYFSTGPEFEKPIFVAVMDHLDGVGAIHVEPVSVGIFLKRARTFAQLRPMLKWVALSFSLPRRVEHPRIKRKVENYRGRYYHVANVRGPEDIDEDIRNWLTEAYFDSPE